MATIGQRYVTLSDLKGRLDPSGMFDPIIEQAVDTNQFLQQALILEGNETSGHTGTVRTGLPSGTFRKIYGGVQPEASSTMQLTDTVGILESFSKVDEHLAEMSPDANQFRAQEDAAFFMGMTQTMEGKFFYGNTDTAPEEFTGLSSRYSQLTGSRISDNVLDAGGTTGDQTSIWLVTFDPMICHMIYGKGTRAGFQATNMGRQLTAPPGGGAGEFVALVTHFKWQLGLHLADWRYVARLCNVQISSRDAQTGAGWTNIRRNLIKLVNRPPNSMGRQMLFMTKDTKVALEILASEPQSGMSIRQTEFFGQQVDSIWGRPIMVADQLSESESVVS